MATSFKIDRKLWDNEEVKKFISERPNLDIQGLHRIDADTIRIFYNLAREDKTIYLTSEMIKSSIDL